MNKLTLCARLLAVAVVSGVSVSAQASPVQLLANGGFEAGLTGWTVAGPSGGGCDTGWVIGATGSASGCDGFSPYAPFSGPRSGSRAAYNSFDGSGPKTITLTQAGAFTLVGSADEATLSWWDTVGLGSGWSWSQARVFSVRLTVNSASSTVFSESFLNNGSGLDQDWQATTVDVTSLFSGLPEGIHSFSVAFAVFVPQSFTGPASFGLDDVSLILNSTPIVEPPAAPVPLPGALWLLGSALVGVGARARRR